MGFAENLRQTC